MAGDFTISIKLDAGVTGAKDVKDFSSNLSKLFNTVQNSSGVGNLSESLGIGKLIGGLTIAGLAVQAITAGFREMKDALASVVSEGIKMNEFLESSKLGIATLINANYQMKDVQGKQLEGQEAYNAALVMSEEQLTKIRIAGLKTAATTQQLVNNFQVALSVAGSQNITDLDKILQLTIGVTNAAAAMKRPQEEVAMALRGIITGREVEENTIARSLVQTGQQVRLWQQSGTLLENLNKKLEPFTAGAKAAEHSWAVVKSNIEEAFQVFSGEVTSGLFESMKNTADKSLSGIFNMDSLGISQQFGAIVSGVKSMFSGVGVVIGDTINAGFEVASQFNAFLVENAEMLEEWKQGFREIWIAVKETLKTLFDVVKAIFGVEKEVGNVSLIFNVISFAIKGIALIIAGIADGVRVVGGALIWVAGLILEGILWPIRMWLDSMGEALNMVKQGWGDSLLAVGAKIDGVGAKVRGFGADLFKPFAEGNSAVQKVMKSFESTGKAAEDMGNKSDAANAKIAKAKFPYKQPVSASAQSAIAKAQADATIAIAKDSLARQQRDLDYALSQQLVSIKEYYAKRSESQLRAIKIEEDAKAREIAVVKAAIPNTPDEALQKQASVIKLQNELNLMRMKEGDILTENSRKEQEALEAITLKVLDIRAQLEQSTGQSTFETMAQQVQEKFRVVRDQFISEFGKDSEQVGLVDNLVNVETAKGKFAIIQKEYNDTLEAMRIKEQEIQIQETQGMLGPVDAWTQMNDLHRGTAAELQKLIPLMEAYAKATGDPAMVNNVKQLKLSLSEVNRTQSELSKSIEQGLTSNLTTFFQDLASGAKTGSDAVRAFGRAVLATFTQIASQQMAMSIMKNWFGFGSSPVTAATGGYIIGPGTSTSDSIPALLSNGEYVVKASAVKRLGVGFLNLLNGLPSSHGSRFADGGPVTSSVGPAAQVNANTKIVNVFDPSLVEDMMKTPKGEKAVLNVIASNPQFMRAILAR